MPQFRAIYYYGTETRLAQACTRKVKFNTAKNAAAAGSAIKRVAVSGYDAIKDGALKDVLMRLEKSIADKSLGK